MYLNPYLFLLLKKLVENEVELSLGSKPIISDISSEIADKVFKNNPGLKRSAADKIYKIWSYKSFEVDEHYLDMMASFLKTMGTYDSWQYFVEVEGNEPFCREIEEMTSKPFLELTSEQQLAIKARVDKRASEITFNATFNPPLFFVARAGDEVYAIEDPNNNYEVTRNLQFYKDWVSSMPPDLKIVLLTEETRSMVMGSFAPHVSNLQNDILNSMIGNDDEDG